MIVVILAGSIRLYDWCYVSNQLVCFLLSVASLAVFSREGNRILLDVPHFTNNKRIFNPVKTLLDNLLEGLPPIAARQS